VFRATVIVNSNMVAACTTGEGASEAPKLANGNDQQFTTSGLVPNVSYKMYVVTTDGQRIGTEQPFTTKQFTKTPEIPATSITPTGFAITTTISSAEPVRCVAYSAAAAKPNSAADVTNAVQSAPNVLVGAQINANPNVEVRFNDITGMDQGLSYQAYCATYGPPTGALSQPSLAVQVGDSQLINSTPQLVGAAIPPPTGFDVTIIPGRADSINCALYDPENPEPTGVQVYAGTNARQTLVAKAGTANNQLTFRFTNPLPGRVWAYCASQKGSRTKPLEVRIAGFSAGPTVGSASYNSFTATLTVTTREQVRCVAVLSGKPGPPPTRSSMATRPSTTAPPPPLPHSCPARVSP